MIRTVCVNTYSSAGVAHELRLRLSKFINAFSSAGVALGPGLVAQTLPSCPQIMASLMT